MNGAYNLEPVYTVQLLIVIKATFSGSIQCALYTGFSVH